MAWEQNTPRAIGSPQNDVHRTDIKVIGFRKMVHDIDLKDRKFGRPETSGIERLIAGICTVRKDDEAHLVRGWALFDDLYASFVRKGR